MAVHKPHAKKRRLGSYMKSNQNIPVWVTAKTGGKLRRNDKKRNYRRSSGVHP
ncbi:MAG: 50S ribosomal protein L39e [Candidatus Marsarchaeota archaeon]|nr:50S ribosomal protein L39e [Candidatus Marsarchaeota archaeon]